MRNKIPFTTDWVIHKTMPIGSHTIAAPKSGIKDANIRTTEKSKEPGMLKQTMMIKETMPWYKATRMYPEKRFFIISANFCMIMVMCTGFIGIAF